MKTVKIEETVNGYIVLIQGTVKFNGIYVFKSIEWNKMLELIGNGLLDQQVEVKTK